MLKLCRSGVYKFIKYKIKNQISMEMRLLIALTLLDFSKVINLVVTYINGGYFSFPTCIVQFYTELFSKLITHCLLFVLQLLGTYTRFFLKWNIFDSYQILAKKKVYRQWILMPRW